MLEHVKRTEYIKQFVAFLFFLVLVAFSSTKLLAATLFGDWYGFSHVDISPLFLHYTPQVSDSVSFFDKLSIFYSFEKSFDVKNPKPLYDGFTLFSTFSSFLKLSDVKYWQRGGYYDLWCQLIQLKLFNQRDSLNIKFGLGLGLSIESVSISLGNSKFLEDFDEFSFPHENRVHLLNLLARFVFSFDIPTGLIYASYLRYSIAFNVIWTVFGPFADPLVLVEAPDFERTRTQWQHSIAFKLSF
ncbi:hypothetical protein [Fervidobacterium thailandense]|uniref:Outer membrane protein beta-barrel domain-containing protein n=1 Tax=Fervidobacterium thailandense TaxID=1008305 RepID=A0A1E3G2C2_9BACT|nr:hypothetical protein [Fervidobacterium thailandense]ODN30377.1 hypothetical protein A4H02_05875 [Fervidobacterium thailandense]